LLSGQCTLWLSNVLGQGIRRRSALPNSAPIFGQARSCSNPGGRWEANQYLKLRDQRFQFGNCSVVVDNIIKTSEVQVVSTEMIRPIRNLSQKWAAGGGGGGRG